MKEEILNSIRYVKQVVEEEVYPLADEMGYGEINYYWEVLACLKWAKEKYPELYEKKDADDGLTSAYQAIDEFGHLYSKVFLKPLSREVKQSSGGVKFYNFEPILHDDGILGIGLPIEKMITDFYEYVINLNDGNDNTVGDGTDGTDNISKQPTLAELYEMQQNSVKLLAEMHKALFQKPKEKADKQDVIDAGIMFRLTRTKK